MKVIFYPLLYKLKECRIIFYLLLPLRIFEVFGYLHDIGVEINAEARCCWFHDEHRDT